MPSFLRRTSQKWLSRVFRDVGGILFNSKKFILYYPFCKLVSVTNNNESWEGNQKAMRRKCSKNLAKM